MRRALAPVPTLLVLSFAMVPQSFAAALWWSGASGNFTDNSWVTGGNVLQTPVAADQVVVGNGGTVAVTANLTVSELITGRLGGAPAGQTGVGTINITSGTASVTNFFTAGRNDAGSALVTNGTINLSGGTVNKTGANPTSVGRQSNATGTLTISASGIFNHGGTGAFYVGTGTGAGGGSNGTLNVSGGQLNFTSSGDFLVGADGNATIGNTGVINLSGGTVTLSAGARFGLGSGVGSSGTFNLSGTGAINLTSIGNLPFVIGRQGGSGSMVMTGGTVTKSSPDNVVIGATNTGVTGSLTQSAGTFTNSLGRTIIAEQANAIGTLTLSSTAQMTTPVVSLAEKNNLTQGTMNLNGGTLTTGQITGAFPGGTPGTSTVNFDGGLLKPTADNLAFITSLTTANLAAGGLQLDTNGKNVTSGQSFSGVGGITKSGLGTFTLTGTQTYGGTTSVSAGKMVNTSSDTARGVFDIASSATLGVTTVTYDQQLTASSVILGASGTKVDFDLGNLNDNSANAALNVTGNFTVNGPVVINVADANMAIGTVPLISYVPANRVGTGTFSLGTLPPGVTATLVDDTDNGLVYLDVESVSLLLWEGLVDGVWDVNNTSNWFSLVTFTGGAKFLQDASVRFNDDTFFAPGEDNIVLSGTLMPSNISIENSLAGIYTFTGSGKISGPGALQKSNSGTATISTANDYTGVTTISGGTLEATLLANGGAASSIGASTSAAANLVLTGGTLAYTGAAITTDRSLTVTGVDAAVISAISTTNDLTLSGSLVSSSPGTLNKGGTGLLILNNPGSNALGGAIFSIVDGSVTVANGTYSAVSGVDVGETSGSASTLTVNGTSVLNSGARILAGHVAGATGNIVVRDTAVINRTSGIISVGEAGIGTLTVRDSGQFLSAIAGNFNISDQANSQGTLTLQDNGVVNVGSSATFFGKSSGSSATVNISAGTYSALGNAYVASEATSSGTIHQTGGNVTIGNDGGEVMMGNRGTGIWNLSAGTVNARGVCVMGRQLVAAASGTLNVWGTGVWNQLSTARFLIVGEQCTGTLNITGGGAVNSFGDALSIGHQADGTGTVNLDGGTLTVRRVQQPAAGGASTFNFNGGTLKAGANANPDFFTNVDHAVVKAGGAIVDTNGASISFNQNISNNGGGGTFTKTGAGALYLNGASTNVGTTTTVSNGTLGGTGAITGIVSVGAGADLAPGPSGAVTGTLAAGTINFSPTSTLTLTSDGASTDQLLVGSLNLNGAALVISGTLTQPLYIIANYTLKTGTFSGSAPSGYAIDYNYLAMNQIALVQVATPYSLWASAKISNPADRDPGDDPDGDGILNIGEFGLDGDPVSGTNSGKVVGRNALVDGIPTLVLTLPVRNGASFSGTTQKNASVDGIQYSMQASDDLAVWNILVVTEVTGTDKSTIETGLPALDSGWTYRTFRSPGNVAGDPLEFIRAVVVNPG